MRFDGRVIIAIVLAGAALAAWLLWAPRGFWPDFIWAGSIVGILLLGLRWSAAKQSVDQDLGPGQRHEARTTPQWDPALLASHVAVRAFVDHGDAAALARHLEAGAAASRLRPLLEATPPAPTRFIHPAWLYGGLAASLAIIAANIAAAAVQGSGAQPRFAAAAAFIVVGLVGYFRMFNRYGAPWGVASGWAAGCVFLALAGIGMVPGAWRFLFFAVPRFTVPILFVFLAGALLAWPYSRIVKPRYLAQQMDAEALAALRGLQVRQAITLAVVGAIAMAVLLGILGIPAIRGGTRRVMETTFGLIPGLVVGLALPYIARAVGISVGGAAAMRRLATQRAARAQTLVRLLSDVTP